MSLPVLRLPKRVYPRVPKALPLMEQYPLYALLFDGVDDYVKVLNAPSLNPTAAITIEAWVSCGASPAGNYRSIVRKESTYAFRFADTGYLQAFIWQGGVAKGSNIVPASVAWVPGRWVHWVFTYDGSYMRIFKNGVEAVSPLALTGAIDATTTDVGVGATGTGAYPFVGSIALPRIYNRALSLAEIHRNMRNPLNPVRDGLVLWLPMIEGIGTSVRDFSGYGNNGTLYNGVGWRELMKYEVQTL